MNNYEFINNVKIRLSNQLSQHQIEQLEKTLFQELRDKYIQDKQDAIPQSNDAALSLFISSKKIEGCSIKSLKFYENILGNCLSEIAKHYYEVTTEDIREYISKYQDDRGVSKITVDNTRRVISSFFSWLETEDYIVKSPARRIRKIKTDKIVKQVYNDEVVELIRQGTKNKRDLAIVDFLFSTGIRVGELVRLNIKDIDFENKECLVFGKGNKQRKVYFDAKTKIHIQQYLEERNDQNEALFVALFKPHNRLQISGVEIVLRKIGKRIGIRVHPHKFRRTLATKAIDKGMPIEQVQHLLGHSKIDTTLGYAMVDDSNVKISHRKYLE